MSASRRGAHAGASEPARAHAHALVGERVRVLVCRLLSALSRNESPVLALTAVSIARSDTEECERERERALGAGVVNERSFARNPLGFGKTWLMLNAAHRAAHEASVATQRDVYYTLCKRFADQQDANQHLVDASRALDVPRSALCVHAMSRGTVWGQLRVTITATDGARTTIDCAATSTGWAVPGDIAQRDDLRFESSARAIVVVEKDGVFARLIEDRVDLVVPCILITARGFPDMATRCLVRRLRDALALPVAALVDFNPDGVRIVHTYRHGSVTSGIEGTHYGVPLEWVALRADDVARLALPDECMQQLTPRDRRVAEQLLRDEVASEDERRDLAFMLTRNAKAELQALQSLGLRYLSDTLLTRKLVVLLGGAARSTRLQ